jgi:aminocarboxymuconate-semialdehyde decarboxylase
VATYTRINRYIPGPIENAPAFRVTLDERADLLAESRVDVQVLSVGAFQPYLEQAAEAAAVARFTNDLYADVCKGYDGRFVAAGTVPLPDVDVALEEATRCLDVLGMPAVNVGTSVAGRPLDDAHFAPFFAEMDRRQAVLILHPQGLGAGPMGDAYGMPFLIGVCFEDTVTAVRLVASGLTTSYPHIRFVIPHLGGTLPFLKHRIDDHGSRPPFSQQIKVPDLMAGARGLYFDTVNNYAPALRCACEAFGASHIMLGTDFPVFFVKPCVEYIEQSGLPDQDIETILDRSAQQVLQL